MTLNIPVTVSWPALSKLEIVPGAGRLYTKVTLPHAAKGYLASGVERKDLPVRWTSSNWRKFHRLREA